MTRRCTPYCGSRGIFEPASNIADISFPQLSIVDIRKQNRVNHYQPEPEQTWNRVRKRKRKRRSPTNNSRELRADATTNGRDCAQATRLAQNTTNSGKKQGRIVKADEKKQQEAAKSKKRNQTQRTIHEALNYKPIPATNNNGTTQHTDSKEDTTFATSIAESEKTTMESAKATNHTATQWVCKIK